MKKAFLVVAGIFFIFGTNSDASAHPKIQAPDKVQAGYHANGVAGTIEFVSRRHHRRHSHGHFRGNRHSRHFSPGYGGHRQGYNRHYYGGLYSPLYGNYYGGLNLYSPYPYGNYNSGRHFYRGRGYTGNRNHDRHDRHPTRPHRHHSPKHRH